MSEMQSHAIGLMGQGLIHQQVKRHLEKIYQVMPLTTESSSRQLADCSMIVYCSDTWSPRTLREVNRRCIHAGVALLPVYTQFDEGVLGPCVVPHKQGCASCAELRRLGATTFQGDRELLHQYLSHEREPVASQPWLSSFSLETLAALASEEIATYLQQPGQLRTASALFAISLATLESRHHAFLPFSACLDCGQLPSDEAEQAVIELQSRPKADVFSYRISQPLASPDQILSTYVEPQTGLIPTLAIENSNLLPTVSSHLFSGSETMTGNGCTLRPEQSQVVSVLEAIERYAGSRPRGKRTTVQASYNQLIRDGQPALDPTILGLHTPEQYAQHKQDHACRQLIPYHHDLLCRWVWGYSFQRQAPLLIPEHSAYYSVPASTDNPVFAFEISNGCALGNCQEEAIFHGMLEVAERDAFLLTWYARLQVPRLDLRSLDDPTIRLLIEHLEYHSGYTIRAFNITLDHAIPCICLLCVDEQNRTETPKAFVAAGSHPHPEQAMLKALREFSMFLAFPRRLNQQNRAEALMLLADSNLVRKMDQHPLVYYLPEAFERLDFLYHTPRQQTFQEGFRDFYAHPSECLDLREDLEALIDYYGKRGIDTMVVDQTAPEHRACGLHCVKVLMPGMIPMTFGQYNRRVTGFERLHQLPYTLGYQDHPLTEAEINPFPHPFF